MNLQTLTHAWRGDLLALLAGALLPWAFSPYHVVVLVFIGLCGLLLSWLHAAPGRAFWRGWLFGLGLFGIGVSWVHVSMNRFGGMSEALSIALTALFVMFLALFPALCGWLWRRWFSRSGGLAFQLLLLVPVLWLGVELLRGYVFTGFPWLSLGYSQSDWPLRGYAPLLGVYGISLAVVLSASLLLYAWLERRHRVPALLGLGLLWLLPLGLSTLDWSAPAGKPLRVSLIQGNIAQDRKWLPEQRIPTLDLYANLSRENWGADLVVWPETAIPAFYHQVEPFLQAVAEEARMNGSELLLGLPVYDQRSKRYYNSMVAMGGMEGSYEKRHLVPFGEYLPLADVLGGFIDFFQIPMADFTPGRDDVPPVLSLAGQKAGISICYEDAFGEEVVEALPEATFLINASNDAWFGDSMAPWQHLQIARMRAMESARYLVRATNTGVSAIIDDKGRILARSPQFETHVLNGEVQPLQGLTPYAVFANLPLMVLVAIVLLVGLWRRRH